MQSLKVPQAQFDKMGNLICTMEISEGEIFATMTVQGKELVFTAARGNKTGKGWASIEAHAVIDKENYKGELQPLPYYEHFCEVDKKNRDRSYTGMMTKFKKRTLVFLEKYLIEPTEEQQMALFRI